MFPFAVFMQSNDNASRRFAASVASRAGTALVVSPEDVQELTVNKKVSPQKTPLPP